MKKLVSLLLVLVLVLGLCACGTTDPEQPGESNDPSTPADTNDPSATNPPDVDPEADRYGGTITIRWTPGDTYDPMFTSGWASYIWSMNVYENILNRDAEGNICPGVCDFELSEDNLTLTLWVRDGVTFHNGNAVTIEDVKASYDRAAVKVSRIKNHVQAYLASEEIDGDKLILKFTEFDPLTMYYFTANQTWNIVLPKEICEKYGTENAIIEIEDAIGTGPYKVAAGSEPGVKMVLERYDGYVAVPEGHTGMGAPKKAYLDSIIIQNYSDSSVAMMALLDGSLNWAQYYDDWDGFFDGDAYELYPDRENNILYACFNTINTSRLGSDPNIRKAIAAAIDYEELMSFVYPKGYGLDVSPMAEGPYYAQQYASADYVGAANIELAKQYLQAAGYNGEEIVVVVRATDEFFPVIRTRLEAAGINVRAEYVAIATIDEYLENHDNAWDFAMMVSTRGDYLPGSLAPNFLTSHWESTRRDELLEIMNANPYGAEISVTAWKELDSILTEELPSICFGTGSEYMMTYNLVWNCEGPWRYLWNSYLRS